MTVVAYGEYRHSQSKEYEALFAQSEEEYQVWLEERDEKTDEFLAYLDANPELYSYTEREVVTMKTDASVYDYGWLAAASYDSEAIVPYLLTEGCETLEGNEAVIAKYITSDNLSEFQPESEWDVVYDGEQLVGQTILCTYTFYGYGGNVKFEKEYEVKIVGCYDNVAAGCSSRSDLLMSAEELKRIQTADESEEIYDENGEVIAWSSYDMVEYNVVLKDYSDIADFQKLVREEFHLSMVSYALLTSADVGILTGMSFVFHLILLVLIVNSSLSIIYAIERDIRMRRQEFALLKAVGYRDGNINLIVFRETLVTIGVAVGIMLAVGNLFLAWLQVMAPSFFNVYYSNISFSPNASVLMLTLAVGIGAPMIGYLAGTESIKSQGLVHTVSEGRFL